MDQVSPERPPVTSKAASVPAKRLRISKEEEIKQQDDVKDFDMFCLAQDYVEETKRHALSAKRAAFAYLKSMDEVPPASEEKAIPIPMGPKGRRYAGSGEPDDHLVLVPSGPKAVALKRKLKSSFSAIGQFVKREPWRWKDHKESNAKLADYLEAGVSLADLRQTGVIETYSHLVKRLGFRLPDLAVSSERLSVSLLKTLYGIDWKRLLVDFGASPYLLLHKLKLPLEDLATLGLAKETLLNWDPRPVFSEFQRDLPEPTSSLTLHLYEPLDRSLFLSCGHYLPSDWHFALNLTWRDLAALGVSASDLSTLWRGHYATVGDILRELDWSPTSPNEPLPRPFRPRKRVAPKKPPPSASAAAAAAAKQNTEAPSALRRHMAAKVPDASPDAGKWDLALDQEREERESGSESVSDSEDDKSDDYRDDGESNGFLSQIASFFSLNAASDMEPLRVEDVLTPQELRAQSAKRGRGRARGRGRGRGRVRGRARGKVPRQPPPPPKPMFRVITRKDDADDDDDSSNGFI